MRSSWPIVFGLFAMVAAAFWYDARNASPNPALADPQAVNARAR